MDAPRPTDALSQRVASALQAFSASVLQPPLALPAAAAGAAAAAGLPAAPPFQPASRAAYLARVATFRISTYFGKRLSPFQCARHGWCNAAADLLRCEWCRAEARCAGSGGQLAAADLRARHAPFCPWRQACSPAHFARLPTPKALRAALAVEGRLLALAPAAAAAAPGAADAGAAWGRALALVGAQQPPPALLAAAPGLLQAPLAAALAQAFRLRPAGGSASSSASEAPTAPLNYAALLILCGWRVCEDSRSLSSSGSGGAKRPRSACAQGGEEEEEEVEGAGGAGAQEVACCLCGVRACPSARAAPAASAGASKAARAHEAEHVSPLLQAARAALAAASQAVDVFAQAAAGGAAPAQAQAQAPAPAPAPPAAAPAFSFHPVRSHAFACPFLSPARLRLRQARPPARAGSASSAAVSAAASSLSAAVMSAEEGALVQETLLEHAARGGAGGGGGAGGAGGEGGEGGASGPAPGAQPGLHHRLLSELVRREEEEEEALEEEEEREGALAGEACEAQPGWVCALLQLLEETAL
jgi:hypothetical protein